VAETASYLSSYVSSEATDEEILGIYELLLRDNEPEVRSEAVAKMPIMARHCKSSLLIEKVLPIIKEQLASDASQHVKGSMAQSICDLAESLSKEETIEHILPPVTAIMKDSATEVRVSLMQNLSKLAVKIGEDELEKLVLPEIINLSKDNTWRVRLATIEFLPQIPEIISERLF
jgi:serine/threonine-protein phosphatase 2A regulatory subunit A